MGYAEKILEPKIKLLEDFGFVDRKLAKVLMSNPNILCLSLKNDLHPKMEFLKNVFQFQDMLIKGLLRELRLLNYNLEKTLKQSLPFLKGWGFCGVELVSFLQVKLFVLSQTSLMPTCVDLIHKIGADKKGENVQIYHERSDYQQHGNCRGQDRETQTLRSVD
ncbi:hypothetical protein SUGI_0345690 [Cryptomeria japonica]|nr:hypothetical protein SUGI_0345690 [Cryptomeria japonica]